MPTPTEPDNYWWTPPPDWNMDTQIVHVARTDDDILCGQSLEQPCMPIRGWERGTWGERIPDSHTLKAMKAHAAGTPVLDFAGYKWCPHCHAAPSRGEPLVHAPDCPWLRAQEKRDA